MFLNVVPLFCLRPADLPTLVSESLVNASICALGFPDSSVTLSARPSLWGVRRPDQSNKIDQERGGMEGRGGGGVRARIERGCRWKRRSKYMYAPDRQERN